jgi:glycosyltransferase involved in cell wall biosynthesis
LNKRVLYILNYPGKGGTEKYVLDMMTAVGFENCILVYSEEGPGLEIFRKTGAATFRVSMRHPFDLKAARSIKKIVHEQGIDVIHAQFLRENYIALLAKMLGAKVKVIWTYHVDVAMNSLIRNLNGIMTRFNSKVIAVSQFMIGQLEAKGIPKDKLQLIYNGVKSSPGAIFDFNSVTPVITVIGRLREEKGQEFLIRSLHYLYERSPELKWQCHIYGEGPDEQ